MGLKEKGISTIHIDSLAINKYDKFCFFTQHSNILIFHGDSVID
jgi:hypothetical protein